MEYNEENINRLQWNKMEKKKRRKQNTKEYNGRE